MWHLVDFCTETACREQLLTSNSMWTFNLHFTKRTKCLIGCVKEENQALYEYNQAQNLWILMISRNAHLEPLRPNHFRNSSHEKAKRLTQLTVAHLTPLGFHYHTNPSWSRLRLNRQLQIKSRPHDSLDYKHAHKPSHNFSAAKASICLCTKLAINPAVIVQWFNPVHLRWSSAHQSTVHNSKIHNPCLILIHQV